MEKSKKIKVIISAVLLALTLVFIWGNSCLSQDVSGSESGGLYNLFSPIFNFIFGEGVITHAVFRKLAHFSEFLLLGLEVNYLYYNLFGAKKEKLAEIISAGLFVAVIDETIQIFSGRGPAVVDVLIDYSGYLTATALFFCVLLVVMQVKNRKKDTKEN